MKNNFCVRKYRNGFSFTQVCGLGEMFIKEGDIYSFTVSVVK